MNDRASAAHHMMNLAKHVRERAGVADQATARGVVVTYKNATGTSTQFDLGEAVETVCEFIYNGPAGDELEQLLERVAQLPRMCHWIQNRAGVQARQSHREFHFGNQYCPYEAMVEVMYGRPDPREAPATPRSLAAPPNPFA